MTTRAVRKALDRIGEQRRTHQPGPRYVVYLLYTLDKYFYFDHSVVVLLLLSAVCGPCGSLVLPLALTEEAWSSSKCAVTLAAHLLRAIFFFFNCKSRNSWVATSKLVQAPGYPHSDHVFFLLIYTHICRNNHPKLTSNLVRNLGNRRLMSSKLRVLNRSHSCHKAFVEQRCLLCSSGIYSFNTKYWYHLSTRTYQVCFFLWRVG